jgi:hypothetical protein
MASKKTTPTVKPARNAKTVKAPAPAPEAPKENRYLRAARILIEIGGNPTDVDLDELAVRAAMSRPTAEHCLSAFVGVSQALRDAKLLPARKAPAKPISAPSKPQTTPADATAEPDLVDA